MSEIKKTAIITGGTGALGSRVTETFLKEGYRIFICDINQAAIDQISASSDQISGMAVNLMDESEVQKMTERAVNEMGSIEVLINTVGGWTGGKDISQTDLSDLDKMFNLNLKTVFLTCKYAFAQMKKQKSGCIINIGSIAANSNSAGSIPYAAAKAGVISLTRAVAEEGKDSGVTANSILPAMLDTPANRKAMPDADFSKWVSPQSIAELMRFLASENGRGVTGASIPVPGGQL
ncbi:MAG: SDR family NAD(P)-dependent oxidoreductase [Spirochaetia bacterium]|nr:SDR family NAD(P)-dependent oxidoreductase [Spirochaetia bacterium]